MSTVERMATRWGADSDGTWHRLTAMTQGSEQAAVLLHTACGRMLESMSAQPQDQPPSDEGVCPDCESGVVAD